MPDLAPFVDPLPIPPTLAPTAVGPDGSRYYRIGMRNAKARFHSSLPEATVWAYQGLFPGPTIETDFDKQVSIEFTNELNGSFPFAIDPEPHDGHRGHGGHGHHGGHAIPSKPWTVVHLHGSPAPPNSDGWPEDALFPGQSVTDVFPRHARAALLWYHDHANMITRLNVYAGLAGLFIVRDGSERQLGLPTCSPYEIPLVIQDRNLEVQGDVFTGRLQYHRLSSGDAFRGDFILVNGKIWPYLDALPGKYRLRILNGSNGRNYRLKLLLPDGDLSTSEMVQIGGDQGFLAAPAAIDPTEGLALLPAERADVVLDLRGHGGKNINLVTANASGTIMQFRVASAGQGRAITLPNSLPQVSPPSLDPAQSALTRKIFLLRDEHNMHSINGRRFGDAVEEAPVVGTTEVWEFINLTGDVHPMHVHLVEFLVLNREAIIDDLPADTRLARFREWQAMQPSQRPPLPRGLRYGGNPTPPAGNEFGPKDTTRVRGDEVTRVIARFGPYTGKSVYHCHILEHEDMDMMRPFLVVPVGPDPMINMRYPHMIR